MKNSGADSAMEGILVYGINGDLFTQNVGHYTTGGALVNLLWGARVGWGE